MRAFRTAFFWPLALDPRRLAGDESDRQTCIKEAINAVPKETWERLNDPLLHAHGLPSEKPNSKDRADAYAEFAYYHDFVQRFLFTPRQVGASRPDAMTVFRRKDLTRACVALQPVSDNDHAVSRTFDMRVDRILLYVFTIGVAILIAELSTDNDCPLIQYTDVNGEPVPNREPCPLNLADVQDFNDAARRAFPPFFDPGDAPGLSPLAFTWSKDGREWWPASPPAPVDRVDALLARDNSRFIKPFEWWSALLPENDAWRLGGLGDACAAWRHFSDDRMPILSWISVTAKDGDAACYYRAIRKGDWMRLCFVDSSGADPYAYDPDFLDRTWKDHVYDRFHDIPDAKGSPPEKRTGSRYLVSGYALIAVGCGGFFDTLIQGHMRRHYYQMMLLSQFELGAMLSFSSRISHAVEEYARDRSEEEFAAALSEIEHDFLQYVHRFRFTGLTGQLQGIELLDMLRKHMRLNIIYDDLREEVTTANDFLAARSQARQTRAATRLSVVAAMGVAGGLAFSFLGMNVLTGVEFLNALGIPKDLSNAGLWVALSRHGALVRAVLAATAFAVSSMLRLAPADKRGARDGVTATLRSKLNVFCVLSLAAAVVLILASVFAERPPSAPPATARAPLAAPQMR